ncbi:LmeA family phospholipid-binding protein, partial [Streptomyces murinus]|uniref:LmeA family phospholipid-binding protein n=1 Tax=Streptomyces murinus TaxID=33900 RepID=UPI003F46B52E
FLTQAFAQDFDHVALTAENFTVDTTSNAQGGYLGVERLRLDLHGVTVTSLTARSAEANLVTGTLTLSYDQLSGVLTRLAGSGGPVKVSQAPGSDGQAARVGISGTVGRPPGACPSRSSRVKSARLTPCSPPSQVLRRSGSHLPLTLAIRN